ncbi:MAG: type II toxin-antitoxin system prevent-host-death family antitoxin [Spirochaetaceae bacterium]|nr:type II toxin-antitoxin system prevent-host-death family antitoxin [Spirochaetaceae bacterium]
MNRINVAEAKARLSHYLARVDEGETVLICRRNVPIAELRPIRAPLRQPRPVGIDRGMTIPDSFFAPLPDDLLDAFEGRGGTG